MNYIKILMYGLLLFTQKIKNKFKKILIICDIVLFTMAIILPNTALFILIMRSVGFKNHGFLFLTQISSCWVLLVLLEILLLRSNDLLHQKKQPIFFVYLWKKCNKSFFGRVILLVTHKS